jgi:hypothetical protein
MKAVPKMVPRKAEKRPARRVSRFTSAVALATAFVFTVVGCAPAKAPAPAASQDSLAPVGAGFNLNASDLRFILQQIKIAEHHASGGELLGPGPNQVPHPRLPYGLRTVDGSFNNLVAGQEHFGQADQVFPRMLAPEFRTADALPPGFPGAGTPTSYTQKRGIVVDTEPRLVSNLIVDQTAGNPSAAAAAGPEPEIDPASGTLFIANTAPDEGLSAPFN